MASAATMRSPVFTPSPSQHGKVFAATAATTPSRTPQRRRSLQSTRTLGASSAGSMAQPARASLPAASATGQAAAAQAARVAELSTPATPLRAPRVAWGAAATPAAAAQPTAPPLKQPEPEPEPEPEPQVGHGWRVAKEKALMKKHHMPKVRPPSLAELRAVFVRMDRHRDGCISRAELIQALNEDAQLRTLLGLPAHIGAAERRVFKAAHQEMEEGLLKGESRYLAVEEFTMYLIHHRLAHAAGEETSANRPAVRVHKPAVMPVLRPVGAPQGAAPQAPGAARFSGLDTSSSKTWPWLPGVNTAWSELEVHLVSAIASCLSPRDVVRAAGVCGAWRRVILRRCRIDSAWAAMFTEKFGDLPKDCAGTSAARREFLKKETTLRSAFRTRKLSMQLNTAIVGGWVYSVSCGGGFVLGGSLCGAAVVVDASTGALRKRLDGYRPTPPGKIGTDCDPAVNSEQPREHHEQFYCCAVASASPLDSASEESDVQVVLGSNHALRFLRLPANDGTHNLDEDHGELDEPEPEEVEAEDDEAQLNYERFSWLVRRQCRIDEGQCPENALRQLFDYIDQDRSGHICGTEFAHFLCQKDIGTFSVFETAMAHIEVKFHTNNGHSLHSAFKAIDSDGSGALDVDELAEALALIGLKLSRAEVMIVLAGLDTDGSGEISSDEFSAGLKIARRKAKQREKAATIKKTPEKCEQTGNDKLDTEHLKTQELISTAFLRLYERLERTPDEMADPAKQDSSMETGGVKNHRVPVPVGGVAAASKSDGSGGKATNSTMKAFRDLDVDDSGSLNDRELRTAFAQLGVVLTRPALAEVMAELDADGSGSVTLQELLDRAFVARLEAVRRRLIGSAVLQAATECEWAQLFERYARGQHETMEGPPEPEKIQSMTNAVGRNARKPAGSAPNVVATSEEHGWVTHVVMVGDGGSPGTKQWRAAETVAVGYQDGTVESWSIQHRRKIWTIPQAHSTDGQMAGVAKAGGVIGLAVIGKGDCPKGEPTVGPPLFENSIVVSAGRWDGVQLRDAAQGECLRIINPQSVDRPLRASSAAVPETTTVCAFRRSVVCGGSDGLLRLWSPSGDLKYTLLPDRTLLPMRQNCRETEAEQPSAAASQRESSEAGAGRVVCAAANSDRVAAVDAFGTLRIWEPICSSEHLPTSALPSDGAGSGAAMVAPQFAARFGEQGWLAHPIWSLSWDGPSKLWCGLESGQLACLDFSEDGTKIAPPVFRPVVYKKPEDSTANARRLKKQQQKRAHIDRLSRPSPRHNVSKGAAGAANIGALPA